MRAHSIVAVSTLIAAVSAFAAEVRLGPETPLSQQQPEAAQIAPLITSSGNHIVALWRNASGTRIDGLADGHPFFFNTVSQAITSRGGNLLPRAAVSIAAGERNALVVWTEGENDPLPMYARRIGFGGEVLDPVAISLGSVYSAASGEPQGVAYDSGAFVVAWTEMPEYPRLITRVARVSPEGALWRDPDINGGWAELRPTHTASGLVIAGGSRGVSCGGICHLASSYSLLPGQFVVSGADGGWAVAAGADRLTFVSFCGSAFCRKLVVAQTSFAGALISRSAPTSFSVTTSELALAWNGGEYVLAWSEQPQGSTPRIRAIRLNANGEFIDPEPFDVTPPFAMPEKPSLAAVPGGVMIAYSRRDPANVVPRAYARTLERLPSAAPRRRSARH